MSTLTSLYNTHKTPYNIIMLLLHSPQWNRRVAAGALATVRTAVDDVVIVVGVAIVIVLVFAIVFSIVRISLCYVISAVRGMCTDEATDIIIIIIIIVVVVIVVVAARRVQSTCVHACAAFARR